MLPSANGSEKQLKAGDRVPRRPTAQTRGGEWSEAVKVTPRPPPCLVGRLIIHAWIFYPLICVVVCLLLGLGKHGAPEQTAMMDVRPFSRRESAQLKLAAHLSLSFLCFFIFLPHFPLNPPFLQGRAWRMSSPEMGERLEKKGE